MICEEQLNLCTSLCEQIKRIDITDLTFGEFVLHVRSVVMQWQRLLALNGPGFSGAPGKVMLAMVYSSIRQSFPGCDAFIEEAVERFIQVKEREDIILSLDSMSILPFVMDLFEKHLRRNVAEIIEQIACLSAGMTAIMDVCRESMEQTVLKNCAGLSIEQDLRTLAHQVAHEKYIELCFSSLFDLISIYPDSQLAIQELEGLLKQSKPDLQDLLNISLQSCKTKLLTPAMSTEAIIKQLVHAIPVFKSVDPTGLILDRCCLMGKEYLSERRDSELHDSVFKLFCLMAEECELRKPVKFDVKDEEYFDYHDIDTVNSWLPDPLAAGRDPVRVSSKSFDPFSILVNLSCSEKLFQCLHHNIMELIVNGHAPGSKILKRINLAANFLFGRAACSSLLVMLHDTQKSHEIFGKNPSYSPLIVSQSYWPIKDAATFSDDLPGGFPDLSTISKRYSESKKKRMCLQWIPELSCVDMDLMIDDINYTLNSVPYLAFKIIQNIISDPSITVFNLNEGDKKGLMFWAERGFIKCSEHGKLALTKPDATKVIDVDGFRTFIFNSLNDAKIPCKSKVGSNNGNGNIPLHVGAMITAMLTNLGPLPATKIHSMLATMSGLKEPIELLNIWLHEKADVQFDPVSGLFSKRK